MGLFFFMAVFSANGMDYELVRRDANDLSFYIDLPEEPSGSQAYRQDVRNVILCIGDGMGLNTIAMARHKSVGRTGKLWLETLPVTGVVRTFSADYDVTDSAAAATAMACGIKTNNEMLGLNPGGKPYKSILEILSERGWRTGLIATSTMTHATPAAFASHIVDRDSEQEIAEQMLEHRVDILLGGGLQYWLPKGTGCGKRKDKKNLIETARQMGYTIVQSREEMQNLAYGPALGLFAAEGMTTYEPEPSQAQMARKAIELLSAKSGEWFAPEPKFFLMIEGSQIDWAGHDNLTSDSIRQVLLFDLAVKEALDFARLDRRTLVLVTSDHETGGLILKKKDHGLRPAWGSGDHSGGDVLLFAYGPGAEEFTGVMDNTDIPKKIAKLMKVSPFPQPVEKEITQKAKSKVK